MHVAGHICNMLGKEHLQNLQKVLRIGDTQNMVKILECDVLEVNVL